MSSTGALQKMRTDLIRGQYSMSPALAGVRSLLSTYFLMPSCRSDAIGALKRTTVPKTSRTEGSWAMTNGTPWEISSFDMFGYTALIFV